MPAGKPNLRWLAAALAVLATAAVGAAGDSWRTNHDKGQQLYNQGKFVEAEKFARLAVEQAADAGDEPMCRSQHLLGLVLWKKGKLDEAEAAQLKALSAGKKAFGDVSQPVGAVLNDLALVHVGKGEMKKADERFEEALKVLEKADGPTSRNLANTLNNIGLVYQLRGRWKAAQPMLEKSLAIWEKRKMDELDAASVLANLGRIREQQGKLDEAMAYFEKAVKVGKDLHKEDHPAIGNILLYMTRILIDRKEFAEAEKLLQKAQATFEKKLPLEHSFRANHLRMQGYLQFVQGKLDQAEPLYRQALAMWDKLPEKTVFTPETLLLLARLLEDQGKLKDAETQLLKAQELYKIVVGEINPRYAAALEQYAGLLEATGRNAEAQKTRALAKEIRAQHARENADPSPKQPSEPRGAANSKR